MISPSRDKNKKYLKPPPSHGSMYLDINHAATEVYTILGDRDVCELYPLLLVSSTVLIIVQKCSVHRLEMFMKPYRKWEIVHPIVSTCINPARIHVWYIYQPIYHKKSYKCRQIYNRPMDPMGTMVFFKP